MSSRRLRRWRSALSCSASFWIMLELDYGLALFTRPNLNAWLGVADSTTGWRATVPLTLSETRSLLGPESSGESGHCCAMMHTLLTLVTFLAHLT